MAKKKIIPTKRPLKKAAPPFREFELAVCAFVKALDPKANVLFDHKVPDRDTGTPRQVDGWVEATVLNHFPVSILVSCKAHKRKVDIQTVGAFINEVHSTGASFGIIYSTSSFTAPALKKAEAHGLSCCRLYRDQPADLPDTFVLWSYCCNTAFSIVLVDAPTAIQDLTWNEFFESAVDTTPNPQTVLDVLERGFRQGEDAAAEAAKPNATFPKDWAIESIFGFDDTSDKVTIRTSGHWKIYRSRLDAHIINGSYCFQNNSFVGSVTTPFVDTQSAHPGPQWEEATDHDLPAGRVIMVLLHGDFSQAARSHYGAKQIRQ